jgi:hypothetical protein
MTRHRMISRCFVAILGISLGFALCTVPAYADADQKGQPTIIGKTYGQWSAKWWQWAVAGPNGENAVQDETGKFCAVNQPKDKVWFLAGTFGLMGVERTCTIPANRALLYPLINTVWTDCPGTTDEDLTDAEVRAILTTFGGGGDSACQLTSTLDGASISSLQILTVRTQSPKFTSILPKNHVLQGCEPPLPPGKTGRQISEGYWVLLPPLTPGAHVLTIHGATCDPKTGDVLPGEIGVTYHLTVLGGDVKDDD